MGQSNRWDSLDSLKYTDEGEAIARLLASRPLSPEARKSVVTEAAGLVEGARSHARRQGVVESFLKEFSLGTKEGQNLLKLLAENDRLGALAEISKQFDALKAEQENKVRVKLVAAAPVDAAQAERISGALGKKLGRKVELELEVDDTLIGGAIVRAEDMVIDDSLKTRLERLASALID